MPAIRTRGLIKALWGLHRWAYSRTGGRVGGRLIGMPVLLLTTTGRKTGRRHTVALTYQQHDRSFVVVASNGGAPRHPDWYANLRAHSQASAQTGRRILRVTARVARGAERDRLWARAVAAYRGYAAYQERTTREIPVIVLEPPGDGHSREGGSQ